MANASQVQLIIEEESTYGETPTGGAAVVLRTTGESLGSDPNVVKSQEIRSDRQVPSIRKVGQETSGDINYELSYSSYDVAMQATLQSSGWSSVVTMAAGPSMTCTGSIITRSTGDFTSDGFLVNQWVRMSGWDDAENNGYFKVTAVGTTTMTIRGTLTTQAVGETDVEIEMGAQIVNGTTQSSWAIEREPTDLSSDFHLFLGQVFKSMSMSIAVDALITGSFGMMGASESSESSSFDASATAANTNPNFSASEDVVAIREAYADYDCMAMDFTLDNNLRARRIVGQTALESIKSGTLSVTGTHRAYYASATVMDKMLNETASALAVPIVDPDGNAYVIEFPEIKYTSGKRVAGGIDTDIVAEMGWEAYRDPSEGITVRIARWAV